MRSPPPRKRLPSKDPIDARANAWLKPPKKASASRPGSALLDRLARRLDTSPEVLARGIPVDTLRRLKYPVIEEPQDDGTIVYKHDLGISDV